jgi:hypothetical protein
MHSCCWQALTLSHAQDRCAYCPSGLQKRGVDQWRIPQAPQQQSTLSRREADWYVRGPGAGSAGTFEASTRGVCVDPLIQRAPGLF